MIKINAAGLDYLVFENLSREPRLPQGVTLRHSEPTEHTIEKTTQALGLEYNSLVKPQQIHSDKIAVVRRPGENVGPVDGLCTTTKNIPLALIGADCPLLIVFDPVNHALGLAHAGWRGTVKKIATKLLRKMNQEFNSNPQQMTAGIGPAICKNCYEVGPEVAEKFQIQFQNTKKYLSKTHPKHKIKKWSLDLKIANQSQLISEGMPKENIEICQYCTFEQKNWFYSYRREGPKTGRNALIAALI
ncbi:MAG: peptidoglycan editing factor PgeF [Planctomycetes bacterium]|nr:peptidoglycan editing factor PgeF [Planctomycetota bacterium]